MQETRLSQRVQEILEWPEIQQKLIELSQTNPAKEIAASITPISKEQIKTRLRKITDIKNMLIQGETPDFYGITDIKPLLALTEKKATLDMNSFVKIKNFITGSMRILKFLKEHKDEFTTLADEYNALDKLDIIGNIILSSITDNNELNDSKYTELKQIKEDTFTVKQEIEKKISKILSSPSMEKALQEKIHTKRNDRYVVLIKSNMKTKIKGTVHDISSSGATLYIEPDEITQLNNRVIILDREYQAEVNRILKLLSEQVDENSPQLLNNQEVLANFDFLNSCAQLSISINGNAPEISDEPELILYDARHPILYLMEPKKVIPNNIEIGKDFNCLIISGANTGGKTVLLKTIGLCTLFTMMGLHIPAGADSKIGIFENILADIGDDQSISQSLSTFSGQLMIINDMIKNSDNRTLVIIDEIIVGTNPRQGAALAQAILEELAKTESKIIVTTHYSELKELASNNKKFQNASVSFDLDTLQPTYKLRIGLPGVSYAIEIAKNYGLSETILANAKQLLDSKEISVESLLEKMQKYEQDIDEERSRLDDLEKNLLNKESEYTRKENKLKQRTQELKHKQGIEFLDKLNEYKKTVSEKINSMQNTGLKDAGQLQKEIISLQETVQDELKKDSGKRFSDSYIPIDPEKINPGDRIFIIPIEKEGKIETINGSEQNASIILGNIRSQFNFKDLLMPLNQSKKTRKHPKTKNISHQTIKYSEDNTIPLTIQTSYNTIDLRGKRVEEALTILNDELHNMAQSKIGSAVVIHGHGTGALKEAVRNNLKGSIYITDFRPGDRGEGGDGVTIVRLVS